MAAIEVESVEDDSLAKNPEDSGYISWNNSQTGGGMPISRIIQFYGTSLKDNANRQETEKKHHYEKNKIISHNHQNSKQFSLSIQLDSSRKQQREHRY